MNSLQCLHTEYLRSSRTIETVLVSDRNLNKVVFIYNYEGNSFRVFESHMSLLNFFQHDVEPDFHFDTEFQLDSFLLKVVLQ